VCVCVCVSTESGLLIEKCLKTDVYINKCKCSVNQCNEIFLKLFNFIYSSYKLIWPILLYLHKHEYYFIHSFMQKSPKPKKVCSLTTHFLTICEQLHTLLPKEPSALCLLGNNRVLRAMIFIHCMGCGVGLGWVECEVPTTKMGSRGDGILWS